MKALKKNQLPFIRQKAPENTKLAERSSFFYALPFKFSLIFSLGYKGEIFRAIAIRKYVSEEFVC